MDLVTAAPDLAESAAGVAGRPLSAIEAALLRLLDTADAIEAGHVPAHLAEPVVLDTPVAPASDPGPGPTENWASRIRHIATVWAVVGALGVVAFNVAPGPARPKLLPPPPATAASAPHAR